MSSGLLYLAIIGVWAVVLVPMWVRRNDAGDDSGTEPADVPAAPRRSGRTRARVVARRRRRLSGIVLLCLVTVAISATQVAPWWTVPVPGAVLAGYLGCLRAAARYDAELRERDAARLRAAEARAAEARAAERRAAGAQGPAERPGVAGSGRPETGNDEAAAAPPPDSAVWRDPRVIDFQERVYARREEVFDQYADPDTRAAGD